MFCSQCNDLICSKCQLTTHKDHNDEKTIIDIHSYIDMAAQRMENFQEKFQKFIKISSSTFPIDDTIFEYFSKQKSVIEVLYDDHKKFINTQFDVFQKRIENLRELELANLTRFRDFFKSKFTFMENKVNEINEEKSEVEHFLNERITDLKEFENLDAFNKEGVVRRIPNDIELIQQKKQVIMNLFREYQNNIGDSDKIKRYFQRAVNNLKENKAYELIKVMEKLYNQLDSKYKSIDMQEYLTNIITELDEYALMNSRNNAPKNMKEILIACFKSKKVLSYNTSTNALAIIEADFVDSHISYFPNFSRSININGILYNNGGWDESGKKPLKYHLSFDPKTNKLQVEPDMIYGHSAHSLVFVPPHYIFCVSGSGLSKCEKYDINVKTWTEVAELNYHRQNSSLFYFNEQYLYVFGGLSWDDSVKDYVFVETVERLDIGFGSVEESQKWDLVNTLKSKDNVIISKSVMTVVPLTSSKILLVGGMFKDQSFSDDVILFDFDRMEFTLLDDLKLAKATCFPNKHFLFFGDLAYQIDNEGDIHEFNTKDWSFKVVNHHKPIVA
jgi:hypothetical protein